MTDWIDLAITAARNHTDRERAAAEADAAETVEYVARLLDQWGVPQGERHGEVVEGEYRVAIAHDLGVVAEVSRDRPEVRAVRPFDDGRWHDCGPVETLIDVGLVMEMREPPEQAGDPDDDVDAGDLLLTVMRGLVRDVVADELDGRLGDGGP